MRAVFCLATFIIFKIMKRNEKTIEYARQMLQAIAIAKGIVGKSLVFNPKVKEGILTTTGWTEEIILKGLEEGTTTMTGLKYHLNIIHVWDQMINIDAELYWWEIETHNLPFERKEALNFVLDKGRFLNIGQAMDARINWENLIQSGFLQKRFSEEQLAFVDNCIKTDEEKRYKMLLSCLKNGKAPNDASRHSASLFYMIECKLLDKYFTPEQILKLTKIL